MGDEDPEKEGWLYKWTNHWKGYQKRWFVLRHGVLSYYWCPEEVCHTCRGTISLKPAVITTGISAKFVVFNGGTQTFYLKGANNGDRQRWVTALEQAKARAVGTDAANPDAVGWLYKWTNNYLEGYQMRWFVLRNGLLSYYRSAVEAACVRTINLLSADIQTEGEDSTEFVIRIGDTPCYYLRAINEEDRRRWVTALNLGKARAVRSMDESNARAMGRLSKWLNPLKGYQERWFVLSGRLLSSYWSAGDVGLTCRCVINLENAVIDIDSANVLVIYGATETLFLKSPSAAKLRRWEKALKQAKEGRVTESVVINMEREEHKTACNGSNKIPAVNVKLDEDEKETASIYSHTTDAYSRASYDF